MTCELIHRSSGWERQNYKIEEKLDNTEKHKEEN